MLHLSRMHKAPRSIPSNHPNPMNWQCISSITCSVYQCLMSSSRNETHYGLSWQFSRDVLDLILTQSCHVTQIPRLREMHGEDGPPIIQAWEGEGGGVDPQNLLSSKLSPTREPWVWRGDPASMSKVEEQWRMVPDINLYIHVHPHTCKPMHM